VAAADRALWLTDRLGLRVRLDPRAGIVRVGRAADNDVAIGNQRVSRYHAQLRWIESSWLVYDLDSTNGTFIDQQRVFPSQPRALGPGVVLRLGDHELQLAESPMSADTD
jgi:pSer/pThr/pTyr-binding forkhead associated (FHA) protein